MTNLYFDDDDELREMLGENASPSWVSNMVKGLEAQEEAKFLTAAIFVPSLDYLTIPGLEDTEVQIANCTAVVRAVMAAARCTAEIQSVGAEALRVMNRVTGYGGTVAPFNVALVTYKNEAAGTARTQLIGRVTDKEYRYENLEVEYTCTRTDGRGGEGEEVEVPQSSAPGVFCLLLSFKVHVLTLYPPW